MTIQQYPAPEAAGIPSGNTAGRPASPVIGDQYYNGQLGQLEIFDGTNFIPCSAPGASPTIAVADVGTSVAYGSAQGAVTITPGILGGPAVSYIISSSTGGYTATTTGTTVTITVGNNDSYTFSGTGVNSYGESAPSATVTQTLTTVPQAPTIGTATTSGANTDVTVTWTLGNNGGKNLSSITITPYLNGTTAQTATTAATTSSTSATIVGLTNNSSYTFKVKATNANGTSIESSATNSVTIPNVVSIEYLVVAGGGGAGGAGSYGEGTGGGGAGGYRTGTLTNIVKGTNYTVTVGGGGAGGTTPGSGTSGSNSVFSTISSTGGGRTKSENDGGVSANGGSGGGGGAHIGGTNGTGNSGGYTPSEGNDGGARGPSQGGGGGGASAAGASSDNGGNGGNGSASSITGSSVTYAGGGGGGKYGGVTTTGGTGGGGGGRGAGTNGVNGTANLGGGGGGTGSGPFGGGPTANGGSGGSGVVVLRWLTSAASITVGAGLTADATGTDGSYSYKKFTAGSGNVSFS